MTMYNDVFISHSSVDSEAATDLYHRLRAHGLDCWFAPLSIGSGQDYSEEIVAAVRSSSSMIVLVSKSSLRSKHVRSEVALAAKAGKSIFPVRLVDIEIQGGLEFFLELSQRIDLFSTQGDPVENVVRAIKGNHVSQGIDDNKSPNLARSKGKFIGIGASILLVIAVGSALFIDRQGDKDGSNSAEAIAPTLSPPEKKLVSADPTETNQSSEENPVKDQAIKLNPQFSRQYGRATNPTLVRFRHLNRSTPENSKLMISFDGTEYSEYNDAEPPELPLNTNVQLLLKVITSDGEELEVQNETSAALAQIDTIIDKIKSQLEKQDQRQGIICSINGCNDERDSEICHPLVKTAAIGHVNSDLVSEIDNSFCENEKPTLCLSSSNLPFKLIPGEELVYSLEFETGEKYQANLPIYLHERQIFPGFDTSTAMDGWVLLPAKIKDDAFQPTVLARYEHKSATVPRYNFIAGHPTCQENKYSTRLNWLVDIDGRGATKAQSSADGFWLYSDPERKLRTGKISISPDVNQIGISLKDATGRNTELWMYDFDQQRIVEETALRDRNPKVVCYEKCYPKDPLAFVKVSQIQFGPNTGSYTQVYDLNYKVQDFLEQKCKPRIDDDCPPFVFNIPADWQDVYSQITLKDGTSLVEERIVLK